MVDRFQSFLSAPTVSHIRRNHGLEHATIHVLSARFPNTPLVGRSDTRGFYLFGNVATQAVGQAVGEALERLSAGEARLAIHPNCGTNLLISAALAGGAAFLSLLGTRETRWRERLDRLPVAVATALFGLLLAQPLGTAAQRHVTTQADPGGLQVVAVRKVSSGRVAVHRVLTRG